MTTKKETKPAGLTVERLKQSTIKLKIVGTGPLIYNSMSLKAMSTLFMGAAKKTAAQKRDIKHNPEEEFVDSCYINGQDGAHLSFPSTGIKRGMATSALETEGVTKAGINRGIYVVGEHINIWGKPYMNMSVVRSSDINRTPDIRTRAKLPRWCSEVTIRFISPTSSQIFLPYYATSFRMSALLTLSCCIASYSWWLMLSCDSISGLSKASF